MPGFTTTLQQLSARLWPAGFDLIAATRVGVYNERLVGRADFQLPDLGDPQHLLIVVGNTRRLWPRFLRALSVDAALRGHGDPLDAYCGRIEDIARELADELAVRLAVRHSADEPPRAVAVQQLAEAAGLCQTAPCRLSVHPRHGPWIALRAAIVLEQAGPGGAPMPVDVCDRCSGKPCMAPFRRALATLGERPERATQQDIASEQDTWLAVRDACPVGRESRYSKPQIDYHYRKDRRALLRQIGS